MLKLKKHFLIILNNITMQAIYISLSLNGTYRLGIIGLYVSIKSPLTKYEILLKTTLEGCGTTMHAPRPLNQSLKSRKQSLMWLMKSIESQALLSALIVIQDHHCHSNQFYSQSACTSKFKDSVQWVLRKMANYYN